MKVKFKIRKLKARGIKSLAKRKGRIESTRLKVAEQDFFFPNEMRTIRASSLKEAIIKLRKE